VRPVNRLATTISLFFQPIFVGTYVIVALSLTGATSFAAGVAWALLTAGLCTGVPTLDLARRMRAHSVSDFQLIVREQRLRPLLVSLACTAVALALVVVADGPESLAVALAAALVTGSVMTVVTTRWKISFHAGGAAGATALMIWQFGAIATVLLPALAGVCWSRIYLRRHTVTQVLAGLAVGAVLTAGVVVGVTWNS
jgi:membrane-associated phospholipid phosphatase